MLYSFFLSGKVAVSVEHWREEKSSVEAAEHGARLQIQRLHVMQPSRAAATERLLREPVYRLDMFMWDGGPKASWSRAHHHMKWNGPLPADRSLDADMQKDPLPWLELQFKDFNRVLERCGATDLVGAVDQNEVDEALPAILAAVRACAKEELAGFEAARKAAV